MQDTMLHSCKICEYIIFVTTIVIVNCICFFTMNCHDHNRVTSHTIRMVTSILFKMQLVY